MKKQPRNKRFRIAIFATTPPNSYSGGRYLAVTMAEALAAASHDVCFVTDHVPIFYDELRLHPGHDSIRLHLTPDFRKDVPKGRFDFVVLVPGTRMSAFYYHTELFAAERGAHLILLNFESGNWFNALSPIKRDLGHWSSWKRVSRHAAVILSIAREGSRWAKLFYTETRKTTRFDYCHPSVNTPVADSVPDVPKEKRILAFARFAGAEHKGSGSIEELLCPSLRGYALVFIVGMGDVPQDRLEQIEAKAAEQGAKVEILRRLSEREKFEQLKRASLVLFPSLFEGFGYPPVEALYCNTPVVAFDLPVLRETCGDTLYYARHGDWEDFRKQIAVALSGEPKDHRLQQQVWPVARLEVFSHRLSVLLKSVASELERPAVPWFRVNWLHFRSRYKLFSDSPLLEFGLKAVRELALRARNRLRRRHARRNVAGRVCYYPAFDSAAELTNHYYRACWYLPPVENAVREVLFFANGVAPVAGERPEAMGSSPSATDHILIRRGNWRCAWAAWRSALVLDWRGGKRSIYLTVIEKLLGVPVVNVATRDLESREYGAYCSLIWKHLLRPVDRKLYLHESRREFSRIAEGLRGSRYTTACVFGTGPSLEDAYDFDFSGCLTIACNSVVQNDRLLDHLQPQFLCAGDAVSHLGVSTYAEKFRRDLLRVLSERPVTFVTTSNFGALLLFHYPHLRGRIILVEQTVEGPNYDLVAHFGAPQLDSTLNIHMLPLAATFARDIWLLGCDGKSRSRDNEDFWAHAKGAQYHDLVDTGHVCHPTFDVHRQQTTYDRFLRSIRWTIDEGERRHGITYHSLRPSNIPELAARALPANGPPGVRPPFRVAELSSQPWVQTPKHSAANVQAERDARLPLLSGISRCEICDEQLLWLTGWVLSSQTIDRIEVWFGSELLGTANLRMPRPDIGRKYPNYRDDYSGFEYIDKLDEHQLPRERAHLKFYSAGEIVGEQSAALVRRKLNAL